MQSKIVPGSFFALITTLSTAAVVSLAWGLAGPAERRGAWLVGGGCGAGLLAQAIGGRADPLVLLATIDAVVFVGFMALTWRSRRTWPLLAASCQGVALCVHAIRLFSPDMSPWTYLTALAVPKYGVLAALAGGAWAAWRGRGLGLSS